VFTVLLGTVIWWFLVHFLPSALHPPSQKWKAVMQKASEKHFACDMRDIRYKVIADTEPGELNELLCRAATGLVRLFFQVPEILQNHTIVECSHMDANGQHFELYCFRVDDSKRDEKDRSVCFGVSRDRYIRMVLLKSPGSLAGVAGTDFISINFESFENLRGCIVPKSAQVEFFESVDGSTSKRRASVRVRIEYE
jgi:hypothetical protein